MIDNFIQTVNWFQNTELVAFIIAVLVTLYKFAHPLVQAKVKTEKNKQLQQALKITDDLATFIIPELATMIDLSKVDRKKEAIRFVSSKLRQHGFSISEETIAATIENAYQKYKNAKVIKTSINKSTKNDNE